MLSALKNVQSVMNCIIFSESLWCRVIFIDYFIVLVIVSVIFLKDKMLQQETEHLYTINEILLLLLLRLS